jgi:hypothetical protein
MGADGTMRLIGSSITSKAMVGVAKGVIYKNGTGIIKEWFWKWNSTHFDKDSVLDLTIYTHTFCLMAGIVVPLS